MTPAIQALLDRARDAGLVGSVSGVPTHTKLSRACDVVIANAAAAEPLVRADTHLMTHFAPEVIRGLKLAMQATGAKRGAVVLKRCDRDARAALARAINDDGFAKFQVAILDIDPYYPAGETSNVVEAVLGGRLDVRHVVFNVMTLFQLAEAQRGLSVTRRLVTLTGAVREPKTLWAPVGTTFAQLLQVAGGSTLEGENAILVGGPMQGRLARGGGLGLADATVAWLPADHPLVVRRQMPFSRALSRAASACSQCQRCTELCPAHQAGHSLRPHRVMRALAAGFEPPELAEVAACSACQLCTYYACPHELVPGALIAEIAARQHEANVEPPSPGERRETRRVPLGRLAKRLGLHGLDHIAPLEDRTLVVRRIELALVAPNGLLLHPTVRVGDRVTFAQIVARPKADEPGVPLHTSIAGVVRSVSETLVVEEIGS